MSLIMLGVGDHGATNTRGGQIRTLALGSCVALIFLHAKTRTVAMSHIALPDSTISAEHAHSKPGYFADTAIPALFEEMSKVGCLTNGKDLIIKMTGGANVMDPNRTFNIGNRNVLAIKKLLWQRGMGAVAEDVGGNISRSVSVFVKTGKVILSSAGMDDWAI